ncbi:hypothetical protein CLV71_108289 [Actinophytocola oryzae]|uniref:Cytokinin riboside 5'-monophosphate phosphoribohydrolase n=1 Tax=Actinophytocola oryzae TaxID=502181 RepID=A0A4R7VIK3_9PSEU|nr:hypothetical protein CLV71_108289 [Actinophytocola oryzae]
MTLAGRGIELVYGGARAGTMGVLADAVLGAGGVVHGVIPQSLVDREVAHTGLTSLKVVANLHERKAEMSALADAYLVLPGGAGTLEEFFEVWTWAQLGLHTKPIGLLDVGGYYQPMLRFFENMSAEGFLVETFREMLIVTTDLAEALDRFTEYHPPRTKWT